jgi:hypothetical protein
MNQGKHFPKHLIIEVAVKKGGYLKTYIFAKVLQGLLGKTLRKTLY